jgi:hypothetical protein
VTDAATNVTVLGDGAAGGAQYMADVLVTFISVPQLSPEQPAPDSVHVTPAFLGSWSSVAVKLRVVPGITLDGVLGASETDTGLSARLTEADFVASARDVAVIVTVVALATNGGAVYTPLSLIVPQTDVHPGKLQVTAVLVAFETVALKL